MLEAPVASKPFESERIYADVLVPRHLVGPFTYLVPPKLKTILQIGQLVVVPFGRSLVKGAVIGLTGTPPSTVDPTTLKEIRTLVTDGQGTEIPPHLLELARMVADSYVAPWGQCLRLILPFIAPSKKAQSRIILTKQGREGMGTKMDATTLTLLRRVKQRPLGVRTSTLLKDRRHEEIVTALLDRGWVQKILIPPPSRRQKNTTLSSEPIPDRFSPPFDLIEKAATYPKEWEARVVRAIEHGRAARLLVQATLPQRLVLLRQAVRRAVESGRKALVVVGEMERTQSLGAILARDRTFMTACLHSAVPADQKAEIWEQIRKGNISVVVGTRSAIFLPLQNLGLIWIDREEDPALKEPQEPRYHAREVAWMRARHEQALLVLASSHLTLEVKAIESRENLLETSVWPSEAPRVEVVDLRHDNSTVLSAQLSEAMRESIARQAGVLLFLNRKGYAGALVCRDCGRVPRCASCAVAFVYSRQKSLLTCHYCGLTNPVPEVCSDCGGSRLQPIGEGTERIEEEVRRRFPSARVLRVDGETMRRPTQAASMWHRIQRREWDVLVGTQVVLRDDLVPSVGLVGIVQADAGLSLPDFRAAERSLHLLYDAIGLAQPLSAGGRIILQTYLPAHHTIQAVVHRDETIFESEEMAQRTVLGFPPACHVVVLHVSGLEERTVERAAQAWATRLRRFAEQPASIQKNTNRMKEFDQAEPMTVLGPVPPPVPRLQGRYRRQILIKSRCRDTVVQQIRTTLAELESTYARRVKFDVDIDPVDMW